MLFRSMAYFGVWNQMYTSGLSQECTLGDGHFDPRTGQLNQMGQRKIQVIFQNFPEAQRGVLVAQTLNAEKNNQRMEVTRNAVRQWYGEPYAAQVAMTSTVPQPASGAKIYSVNTRYQAMLPAPVINNSAGGAAGTGGNTTGGGSGGAGASGGSGSSGSSGGGSSGTGF